MKKRYGVSGVLIVMWIVAWGLLTAGCQSQGASRPTTDAPRLIVLIIVDQLRGDLPMVYHDRFSEGGFRRLMDQGLHYTNAHYDNASTLTAVGHATLATGGGPAEHGIIGNDWGDADGKKVYCTEDARSKVLGRETSAHEGTSPRNLIGNTFGDEWVLASGGRGRVFGISGKDRGAILPAGRLGKAFWFDKGSARFVTSSYYYEAYPVWVERWNNEGHSEAHRGTWDLLHPRETYLHAADDDRDFEIPPRGWSNRFPHELDGKAFPGNLSISPALDAMTCDFAKTLIDAEELGRHATTDILSISLSGTDYIGHAFGPDSLESEDALLRLDMTLAGLMDHIDRAIGLGNTLIVLSSDHGIDAAPEMYRARIPHADEGDDTSGRAAPNDLVKAGNNALKAALKIEEDLITAFFQPGFYLKMDRIAALGINPAVVEHALAAEMMRQPGIALALTRSEIIAGRIPDTQLARRLAASLHATRGGQVLVAQKPHWSFTNKGSLSAMHGSPYRYDTHVPMIFFGHGVTSGRVVREITPRDLAPTIAQYLGIEAPPNSTGQPLEEMLK